MSVVKDGPQPVDWRPRLLPVRNQGEQDCFGFAGCAYAEFVHGMKEYLSVAYLDWRVRVCEWSYPADEGAMIEEVLAVLNAWGCPPESQLPYRADPAQRGDAACDIAARNYRVPMPCRVDFYSGSDLRTVLSAGKVILIGMLCFESYEDTGSDGIVPAPSGGLLGGHANLLCGWRQAADGSVQYLSRNSWGQGFGENGYCWFPESVLQRVCFGARTTA